MIVQGVCRDDRPVILQLDCCRGGGQGIVGIRQGRRTVDSHEDRQNHKQKFTQKRSPTFHQTVRVQSFVQK